MYPDPDRYLTMLDKASEIRERARILVDHLGIEEDLYEDLLNAVEDSLSGRSSIGDDARVWRFIGELLERQHD